MLEKHQDQLNKIIEVARIHLYRMDESWKIITHIQPINEQVYSNLSIEQAAFVDQYIFRFAKLQDLIGDKLFRLLLIVSYENIDRLTFKDILNKIEKLGIIESAEQWIEIRETRNDVSHEYPVISEEAIASLNNLFRLKPILERIFQNCLQCIRSQDIEIKH